MTHAMYLAFTVVHQDRDRYDMDGDDDVHIPLGYLLHRSAVDHDLRVRRGDFVLAPLVEKHDHDERRN